MSNSTPTLASSLLESASAVAALGETVADIAILDEASIVSGMGVVRDHRRALHAYELAFAVQVARFSDTAYQPISRPPNPGNSKSHHIDYWARDNGPTDVANGTNFKYAHRPLLP